MSGYRSNFGRFIFVLIISALILPPVAEAQGTVLLKSNFSDLKDKWQVFDDPEADNGPSRWRFGLAELSGISRDDGKMATALLAGEKDWSDYAVETSIFKAGSEGNLVGIVFGWQGPDEFYIAGYNFDSGQYEIELKTAAGFELVQAVKKRFPTEEETSLRVDFSSSRIRLLAGGEAVIEAGETRIKSGRFGLGASELGSSAVHFGKVRVTGLEASASPGKVLFEEDFSSGKLDKWEVFDDPEAEEGPSRWHLALSEYSGIRNDLEIPATMIIAGQENWSGYAVKTNLYCQMSSGGLTGIVFGYQGPDRYQIAGYNFSRDRFELAERTPKGFVIAAFAEMDVPRKSWIPIRLEFRGRRILFLAGGRTIFDLDNLLFDKGRTGLASSRLQSGAILLDSFTVESLAGQPAAKKELQDLLAYARGAAVIYRPSPPVSEEFDEMLDHSLEEADNLGNTYDLDLEEAKLPEEAVFCFPEGRFVEIHRIGISIGREYGPEEIRFWVSRQTPKSGFEPLATLKIADKADSYQEFEVPAKVAKYLKIQITKGRSAESLVIREMFVLGYFLDRALEAREESGLAGIKITEKEPNDQKETAQALPLATTLGGKASSSDVDFYKISLKDRTSSGELKISLASRGIIRPRAALSDERGRRVEPSAETADGNVTELKYEVAPGDYFLEIRRPDSYLTIVYDDSSSMGGSVDVVKEVLKGYLDNLGPGLMIQLMKYADEPVTISDFTNKPAELRAAVDKEVGGGGSTDTMAGLLAAIESVSQKTGSRAILAVLDDIVCSASDCIPLYVKLWDSILDSRISFSTIGVQSGWEDRSNFFGNTREQIFREIAYASRGEFFRSPTPERIKQSADAIFKELTSPLEYAVTAGWRETEAAARSGSLEVKLETGAEEEASRNVEIIMDASNSMWGQVGGEAKITIARKVLAETINALPETMNVGLRAYGHRYGLNDPKACTDTELLVGIEPVDKKALVETVNRIQLKGKTPLVHSVVEAVKDFEKIPNGSIVLVTDGIESCNGDIKSIAPAIKAAGLELKVHIVGFDIKEAEGRKELESIARSTGGRYVDASSADELTSALGQTLKLEYAVLDAAGKEVARGTVGGEPVGLAAGVYKLRVLLTPEPIEAEAVIKAGSVLSLTLKKKDGQWVLE